jgi:hypothetical protein
MKIYKLVKRPLKKKMLFFWNSIFKGIENSKVPSEMNTPCFII